MNLADITPMILTHNESANLRETLERLAWASQILVVDSFSTDGTIEIAAAFPQVRVIQRKFDHFAEQCNFGLDHIETAWVLSLDADYRCDPMFEHELRELEPMDHGYRVGFRYGIYGHPLRAALYPPRVVLYRRESATYVQDGHAHRVVIDGSIGTLRTTILHDDWKPLTAWLQAQTRYALLEANKIQRTPHGELRWKDRIRKKIVIAPMLTFLFCLFAKGLLLDGWRGMFYTLQRTYAELLLSLVLLNRGLRPGRVPNQD